MLAVADLFVGLVGTCRTTRTELLEFRAEPACWRRFSGPGGEPKVLKPDAAVRVGVGDYELASFVEVDLGTESLPTINRKCLTYVDYWRAGQEQHERGVFPRVWWLVPDVVRLKGIARVIQRLPGEARDIFTVALTTEAAEQLVQLPESGGAP